MTLVDVKTLLEKKASENEIVKQIQQYKVDFAVEKESFEVLERAGATSRLLEVIGENPFADLFFTFPNPGAVVSDFIMVEGWGKTVPDRHLWLFAHAFSKSEHFGSV